MLGLDATPFGPPLEEWLRRQPLTAVQLGASVPPPWARLAGARDGRACGVLAQSRDGLLTAPQPVGVATPVLLDLVGPPAGLVRRLRSRLAGSGVSTYGRLAQLLEQGWLEPVQFRPIDRPEVLATVVRHPTAR